MTIEIWYKLDNEQSAKVELNEGADVDDLKNAVKEKWPELNNIGAARLWVYAAGADPEKDESLDPRAKLSDYYNDGDTLVVVAPQQQQRDGDGENDDNILGRGVYEKLTNAVCFFRDKNSEAIGAGFAVSETTVYSVSHNFVSPVAGMEVTCHFGKPNQHLTRKLQIVGVDSRLDYCILETVGGERLLDFLAISTVPLVPGKQCIVAAFQIGIQQDLKDLDPDLSVGIFKGEIAKLYPRHFVYQCPTFAGDSGGAIVLKDGQVIGIHQETVNQARERIEQGEDLETNSRLESVEASINDLIRSLSSGSIGLQLSAISLPANTISGSM